MHSTLTERLFRLQPVDDQISKEKTVSNSGGELHAQVLEMDYTKVKLLSYFKKIIYYIYYEIYR